MNKEFVLDWIKTHNFNPQAPALLDQYFQFLVAKNQVMNLTAITDEDEVYVKHFLDSGLLLEDYDIRQQKVADVGSGAGFPGIVLKILQPDFALTIVEALEKRCKFLEELVALLGLSGVEVVHARGEEYSREHNETFDVVICRAVANLNMMSELTVRLLKKQGKLICYKGPRWSEELIAAQGALKKLALTVVMTHQYHYEILGERIIGILEKNASTNPKYPRNFGQIKKTPLN